MNVTAYLPEETIDAYARDHPFLAPAIYGPPPPPSADVFPIKLPDLTVPVALVLLYLWLRK